MTAQGDDGPDPVVGDGDTIDAFHRGGFFLVQPRDRGHRAGMDAMLLAALVTVSGRFRLADLGAGAGAAGLAVASRLAEAEVVLVERALSMVAYGTKTLALPQNAHLRGRVRIVEADVTVTGRARRAAGLADDDFDQVIMNPPFNDGRDRATPDPLKAEAHAMAGDVFEAWIRTAGAILKPGGQLSLIARPESIGAILSACGKRFGGLEMTLVHPRAGEAAIRLLVTGIKGSRARLVFRSPLVMHGHEGHGFLPFVDDLNNGRSAYPRQARRP